MKKIILLKMLLFIGLLPCYSVDCSLMDSYNRMNCESMQQQQRMMQEQTNIMRQQQMQQQQQMMEQQRMMREQQQRQLQQQIWFGPSYGRG